MKLIVGIVILCVFCLFTIKRFSKAYQFYQNGEYEKAIEIYKELSKGFSFTQYYHPYFQSLLLSEKFLRRKKLSEKIIKRNPHYLPYHIDLYMIYRKMNENKNMIRVYKNIQEKLKKQFTQIVNVSNTLIRYSLYQEALRFIFVSRGFF